MKYKIIPIILIMISNTLWSHNIDRTNIQNFIATMVEKHDFDSDDLSLILSKAESKEKILEAISRPAEKRLTWDEYRNIFIKKDRIKAGAAFWHEHNQVLNKISEETGVDIEILVGIIGVETYFGRFTGGYRVIDALSTLAFDYPKRSPFFTKELEAYLLLTREEDMDPFDATGSYAGAMGSPQFMPSSYRAYAVDADGDDKRDIWTNWPDVIGSVANYFIEHGWRQGYQIIVPAKIKESDSKPITKDGLKATETVKILKDRGIIFDSVMKDDHPSELLYLEQENANNYWVAFHNFFVITRYNHSIMYALAVHQLGQEISNEVKENK